MKNKKYIIYIILSILCILFFYKVIEIYSINNSHNYFDKNKNNYVSKVEIDENYIRDQVISLSNSDGFIPWMKKYCIEEWIEKWNINCFNKIIDDPIKWKWVKYKISLLATNKFLYKYDSCIYNHLIDKKVIYSFEDIIFYADFYKIKDMIVRKNDVIKSMKCEEWFEK